jgi:hypothetical protein
MEGLERRLDQEALREQLGQVLEEAMRVQERFVLIISTCSYLVFASSKFIIILNKLII